MTTDALVSINAAALRLGELNGGISKHTVRAWVRDRRLEHVRLGRRILIPVAALDALVSAHTVPTSESEGHG